MRSLIAALSAAAVVITGTVAVAAPAAAAPKSIASGTYVAVNPVKRVVNGTTLGSTRTVNVAVTGGSTGVPSSGVGAVAMTISVFSPTATGALVAYAAGSTRPGTATVQFTTGQRSADFAAVVPNSSGTISLFNNSAGSIVLAVDISGYYVAGATSTVKAYHPVKATRVVHQTISANGTINPALDGRGPLPGTLVGAVAVTISEFGATRSGYLTAGASGLPIAPARALHWSADQRAGAFAIVPVDADGTMALHNYSTSSIDVTVDVVGYYSQGAPSLAGTLNNVPAGRVLNPTTLGSHATKTLSLFGHKGIAKTGVRAVVLTVAASSAATGNLIAYPGGSTRPGTANVQFAAGHTTSNVAVVPLSPTGTVTFYNGASGAANIAVDVTGWVLDGTATAPPTQVGRYVRNLVRGQTAANESTMRSEGKHDQASDLVLLDIGAQRNDKTGVQLSGTEDQKHNITYDGLVKALNAYVDGYTSEGGDGTIAIGTSNSADDWTHYTATARGQDWANLVIDPIQPQGATIVAADDIEPGFGTTKVSDALGWKSAYLAATTNDLIFNGSADDCPVDFGANGLCLNNWTQSQLYSLAGGSRTTALPQIYNSRMDIQWANINRVGGGHLRFEGALTEFTLGDSYEPAQGWAALYHALQTQYAAPSLPYVVDLQSDGPEFGRGWSRPVP